jgi:hypothetical protein
MRVFEQHKQLFVALIAIGLISALWFIEGNRVYAGLRWGVYAGMAVGAVAWPLIDSPALSGRTLLVAFITALIVGLVALLRFGLWLQDAGGVAAIGAGNGSGEFVSAAIIEFWTTAVLHILIGLFAGAFLAVITVKPELAISGFLLGAVSGAAIGGLSTIALSSQGILLNPIIFLALVGLVTLVLFLFLGLEP